MPRTLRFRAGIFFEDGRWLRRLGATMVLCAACAPLSCGAGSPPDEGPADGGMVVVAEKRCGESPDAYFSVYTAAQMSELADCTVLVGRFQQDSVSDLEDFAALGNVRKIEGALNVFRSPGFVTLHGLENLEVVEGDLSIHLNPNLESIAALAKLHTVTGGLYIANNDRLPQHEVEWLGARVAVGGTKTLE